MTFTPMFLYMDVCKKSIENEVDLLIEIAQLKRKLWLASVDEEVERRLKCMGASRCTG